MTGAGQERFHLAMDALMKALMAESNGGIEKMVDSSQDAATHVTAWLRSVEDPEELKADLRRLDDRGLLRAAMRSLVEADGVKDGAEGPLRSAEIALRMLWERHNG